MNKSIYLFLITLSIVGCVNVGHFVIGRHWLYFDGEAAEKDMWILGEEEQFVKQMGAPDAYKWERWQVKDYAGGLGILNWGYMWMLNLYYGDTVYVFRDHHLYAKRKTQPHEFAHMKGQFSMGPRIVDRSAYPNKYYYLEK